MLALMNPYWLIGLASSAHVNVIYKPMVKIKRPDDDVH